MTLLEYSVYFYKGIRSLKYKYVNHLEYLVQTCFSY